MRRSCGICRLLPVAAVMMLLLLGLFAVQTDTVADSVDKTGGQVAAASGDPNDLRWDLAKAFKFDWTSAELSAKVLKGADPNAPARVLTVSAEVDILDLTGLVIIDVNSPGVRAALDQNGNSRQYQLVQSDQIRTYDRRNWHWDEGGTWVGRPSQSFNVMVRLTSDAKQSVGSSIPQLIGYIYAMYADGVIKVDVPFDPNHGWHDAKTAPDLMVCVDPTTPPCPGPLQYVNLLPPSMDSRLFNLHRPKTPIPLYKYTTWIKSKAGRPMMGLNDPWYLRDYFPFGDYAVLETELFDPKTGRADDFYVQWVTSNPSGDVGARCEGQVEQGSHDTYDTIRHVIAIHPVEVKIPFVLRNIPIPRLQAATK